MNTTMKRYYAFAALTLLLLTLIVIAAEEQGWAKEWNWQPAKLADTSVANLGGGAVAFIAADVGDLRYTARCAVPNYQGAAQRQRLLNVGQWVVGDPVEVDIDRNMISFRQPGDANDHNWVRVCDIVKRERIPSK